VTPEIADPLHQLFNWLFQVRPFDLVVLGALWKGWRIYRKVEARADIYFASHEYLIDVSCHRDGITREEFLGRAMAAQMTRGMVKARGKSNGSAV